MIPMVDSTRAHLLSENQMHHGVTRHAEEASGHACARVPAPLIGRTTAFSIANHTHDASFAFIITCEVKYKFKLKHVKRRFVT
jgi:hypothetical protein